MIFYVRTWCCAVCKCNAAAHHMCLVNNIQYYYTRKSVQLLTDGFDAVTPKLKSLFLQCQLIYTYYFGVFLQTAKQRAEARLELLRSSGVNVDEWLNGVDLENDDEADAGVQSGRCSPALSARSDSSYERVSVGLYLHVQGSGAFRK